MRRPLAAAALLLAGLLAPAAGAAPLEGMAWDGPDTNGVPAGPSRHFRLALDVTAPAGLPDITGLPVGTVLDLADELAAAGYPHDPDTLDLKGFRLDLGTFVLHEVDANGNFLVRNVAVDVRPSASEDQTGFDAAQNPVVAVRWAMPPGPATGARHFHLYFDSAAHGPKDPVLPSAIDLERLASSVGPGRGTRLYAALPPLAGALQGDEPRSVRITAPDGARATVHEYNDQFGAWQPMATTDIPAMQARAYRLGNGGAVPSRGLVMVTADRPVLVEATYRGGSGTFLPALQGGAVGTRFFAVPATNEDWSIVCPKTPETPSTLTSCKVTVRQGASQVLDIGLNGERRVSVAAGQGVQVEATLGQVAVQRVGTGLSLWPPLDGPKRAALFIGEAAVGDRFQVAARQPGTTALVQSLEGARPVLDPNLRLDAPLDASWARNWITGKDHAGGTAMIQAKPGGLLVVNGVRDPHDSSRYGALVALPSQDGGYSYLGHVPKDAAGAAVGGLVVFAPSAGTTVQARRADGSQVTTTSVRTQGDHEPVLLEGAGVWQVTADRPVVAQWLALGQEPFGGFASGFTDAATVQVVDAQYAARAFDLQAAEPIVIAQAGQQVTFEVQVRNAGRTITGAGFADSVQLSLPVPAGWDDAEIVPALVDLAPGGSKTVEVHVTVPEDVGSASGASLTLMGTLAEVDGLPESALVVTEPLRISFTVLRAVEVTADGFDGESERPLDSDLGATFAVHVINTGSVTDTYDLAMSAAPIGWDVDLQCEECEGTLGEDFETPPLEPGEALEMAIRLELTGASAGRAALRLQATSQEDRSVFDAVRMVAATDVDRSVTATVRQPVIVTAPGTVATFTVVLTNTGDAPEELNVSLQSFRPQGWEEPAVLDGERRIAGEDTRISLEADRPRTLTVRQPVPKEAQSGQLAFDRLEFASTFSTKLAFDVELRAVAGRVDGVTLEGPSSLALLPGQAFEVELALASASNHNVTARIEPRATFAGAWSFEDSQGAAPPWNVTLSPGERKVVVVSGRAPPGLPPTQAVLHRLEFRLLAPGTTGVVAVVPLSVPAIVAVRADIAEDRLVRGVENLVAMRVANDGNLPVEYTSSWVGLPEGWTGTGPRGHLAAGSAANATGVLTVPSSESGHARDLTLRILSADGETLADVPVRVGLGMPTLAAELGARLPLAEGRSTYRILVSNLGNASAYDVRIRLERDGEVLDQALLHQVRPGAVQQANLLGPSEADGLRIVVESPQGKAEVDVAASAAGKDAPVPVALALAALAAAVAVAGRRGRRDP